MVNSFLPRLNFFFLTLVRVVVLTQNKKKHGNLVTEVVRDEKKRRTTGKGNKYDEGARTES